MNINLHIERLVLDGLDIGPGQGTRIKAAVEAELARLLTDGGITSGLQGGVAVPSLCAGSIQLESGANPQQLGEKIARTVHGSLNGNDRSGIRK